MPALGTRNALYGSLLIMSAPASVARAELPVDPAAITPLPVGARAPDFTVRRADGTPYVFNSRHLAMPHIVIFYHGGWCPYCNAQLSELRLVEPKLRASGFLILFVSTDRPSSCTGASRPRTSTTRFCPTDSCLPPRPFTLPTTSTMPPTPGSSNSASIWRQQPVQASTRYRSLRCS
jgi:hypothetical protein